MITETNACREVPSASARESETEQFMPQPDDLASRVIRSLFAHAGPTVGKIEVTAEYGTVTVRGQVPDRHVKWLCLECCRHVAGVNKLIDELEVRPSPQNGLPGSSSRVSDAPERRRKTPR